MSRPPFPMADAPRRKPDPERDDLRDLLRRPVPSFNQRVRVNREKVFTKALRPPVLANVAAHSRALGSKSARGRQRIKPYFLQKASAPAGPFTGKGPQDTVNRSNSGITPGVASTRPDTHRVLVRRPEPRTLRGGAWLPGPHIATVTCP